MPEETTKTEQSADVGGQNERLVSHCHKCGDKLTGHEDESKTLCRWCVTGWGPEPTDANSVYEKGQLVYG